MASKNLSSNVSKVSCTVGTLKTKPQVSAKKVGFELMDNSTSILRLRPSGGILSREVMK